MAQNYLTKVDFTKGVKAKPINDNFEMIQDWIDTERLQSAGWGVVSGFECSRRGDEFIIDVAAGELINKKGHRINLDAASINVGAPQAIQYFEKFTLDASGQITLRFPVYAPSQLKQVAYISGVQGELPDLKEFRVYDLETQESLQIASINKQIIHIVDPEANVGRKVGVVYHYASSHIDTITYNDKTPELYPKYHYGIFSASPAFPPMQNFEDAGDIVLGWAYWIVDETGISVKFFYDNRNTRAIYVDEFGDIYFYGKLYSKNQRKFIYFIQPEHPEPNDLWYDSDTNILYIWRQFNGEDYQWVPVNEHSTMDLHETKLFIPDENLTDEENEKQTFVFDEDDVNMFFIPRSNSLDVYIDQGYIMKDQYVEMVMLKEQDAKGKHLIVPDSAKYKMSDIVKGVGFKLNYALNEPTVVQVNVRHTIKKGKESGVFQRAAVFVEEKRIIYNEDSYPNNTRVIKLPTYYEYGKQQIEVFLNGLKLHNGSSDEVDFSEVLPVPTEDNSNPTLTNKFIINNNVNLKYGDRIIYRISHYTWSYEQLESIITNAQNGIKETKDLITAVDNKYSRITDSIDPAITAMQTTIQDLKTSTLNTDNFIKRSEKITKSMLDDEVKNGLFKTIQQYEITIDPTSTIYPLQHTVTDKQLSFVLLDQYVGTNKIDNANISTILNYGTDYVYVDNNKIKLSAGLIRNTRKLKFMVISFGA